MGANRGDGGLAARVQTSQSNYKMSVSDNSTIAPSSDIDGSFQSQDERTGFRQKDENGGVTKKVRHAKRLRRSPLRSIAAVHGDYRLEDPEPTQQGESYIPQEGEGNDAVLAYENS
jgi:hypothetical protein